MTGLFAFLFLLLLESFPTVSTRKCPCEDPSYCETITRAQGKEFLMFSTKPNVWRKYDWSKVTTIALFRPWDDDLMCEAHRREVRVVLSAKFPTSKLSDKELRTKWILNLTQEAVTLFADGVNIDIEEPIPKGSPEVALLTELVKETAHAFRSRIPGSQVSFDVAWYPGCTYGRCYDVTALSEVVDFLVIMAYDEQIQRKKECIAKANSPLNQTREGVAKFLSLGVKREKLVLGLPWYGYDFPCQKLQGDVCTIKRFPFEVNSCGPGAHKQIPYTKVRDLMVSRMTRWPYWDPASSSWFFNYEDSVGVEHQVWYDNPHSLTMKYKFAANEGLNGVAIWNADHLDYSDLTRAKKDTKEMWDALLH